MENHIQEQLTHIYRLVTVTYNQTIQAILLIIIIWIFLKELLVRSLLLVLYILWNYLKLTIKYYVITTPVILILAAYFDRYTELMELRDTFVGSVPSSLHIQHFGQYISTVTNDNSWIHQIHMSISAATFSLPALWDRYFPIHFS